MAWRQYDWQCTKCGYEHADLVSVPHGEKPPPKARLDCPGCGGETLHEKLLSLPAPYLGEKAFSPIVSGGKFDTAGCETPPPLPDVPEGLSGDDVADFFQRPEYKDAKRRREEVKQRNAAKRKRLAAHRRTKGGVDFRRHRLKGDPKLTS